MPDRENDILTKDLGNKEHPGQTRGIGSKVPWKKGFPQDLHRYKCRKNAEQRRIEEFKAAFEEMYEEKKNKNNKNKKPYPPFPFLVAQGLLIKQSLSGSF